MIAEHRVVEGYQVRELGQVLLNDGRIVLPEKVMHVFRNEGRQTRIG